MLLKKERGKVDYEVIILEARDLKNYVYKFYKLL